jgi:hypothetical protein
LRRKCDTSTAIATGSVVEEENGKNSGLGYLPVELMEEVMSKVGASISAEVGYS